MDNFGKLEREYLEPPEPPEPEDFDTWVSNWHNVMAAINGAMKDTADRLIRGAQAEDANEVGNAVMDILRAYYEDTA